MTRPDSGERRTGDGPQDESLWAAAGEHTGYGLTWALSVLLFLLGGWWLDGKLGTEPLFLIVGAFVGAAAGFYSLWVHLVVEPERERRMAKEREDEAARDRGDEDGS